MIGSSLSHFQITAKLGEGGMGEVYRAEDTKLGRQVAIKVLPEAVASDPERLGRFEREAKVVASLNHPNIAAIYSLESAQIGAEAPSPEAGTETPPPEIGTEAGHYKREETTVNFLVMELVEGMDLHERLGSGSISVEQALPIASQMAQALEAAHEKGVIHRDLKPANVKVTPDGQVKVLDFGLAKALDPAAAESGTDISASPAALSLSPTLTQQMTSAGIILGTAAYMSPEQAKGETVDKRADIWSFGLVVFEMLTGKKLFAADSVAETLAGVIKTEIEFDQLPSDMPSEIGRLLRRCLERDAKNRLHDIADARIVIEDVLGGRIDEPLPLEATPLEPKPIWERLLPYCLAVLGITVGLLSLWRPWATDPEVSTPGLSIEFEIPSPEETTLVSSLALSPDGQRLVMVAKGPDGQTALWVRNLESVVAQRLSGTTDARYPFWAPTGKQIGFFAEGKLKVTDLIGSPPRDLADTDQASYVRGGSWGMDDTIVYAPTFIGPLMRISAQGGEPSPATEIPPGSDTGTQRFPTFLADGRHFVFYASPGVGTEPGTLLLGELGSVDSKELGPTNSMAVLAEPDSLLYVRGETLVAQRIDLQTYELTGEPEVLGVSLPGSFTVSGHRSLTTSRGILAYRQDTRSDTRLVWADRSGQELGEIYGDHQSWNIWPRFSPDGSRLLVGTVELSSSTGDIWLHDLDRGIASPLRSVEGHEQNAIWSPDGKRIAFFSSNDTNKQGLYISSVDRLEQSRLVFEIDVTGGPEFWTTDGERMVINQYSLDGRASLWLANLEGASELTELFPGPGSRWGADPSPDGEWIAYISDETRQPEIYVRRFDGDGSVQRISRSGGTQPAWRRDGRELFYINLVGEMVAVPVNPGNPPEFGQPQVLFNARLEESLDRVFDVHPDNERFVLNQSSAREAPPIVVTTDWNRLIKD